MSSKTTSKKGASSTRPKSSQGKGKAANKPKLPTEKEKQLQDDIDRLETEVLMLRCNLNPEKIEDELRKKKKISSEDMISMLQEQVRQLNYRLQEYETNDTSSSKEDTTLQTIDKTTHEREIQERDQKISALEEQLKNLAADRGKEKEQNSAPAKSTVTTQQLQEKCNTLENEIKIKDSEIRNHKVTIDEQKGLIDKMKKNLNEEKLKNETRETNFRKAEQNQENNAAVKKDTGKEMQVQLDKLKSTNEDLEKERNDLKSANENLEKAKQTLESIKDKLEKDKETLQNSYDDAITDLKSKAEEIKKLEENTKNSQKKVEEKEEEIKKLKSNSSDTDKARGNEKESLVKENDTLKRAKEKLEQEKKNLQKSYDDSIKNLKSRDETIKQLEETIQKKHANEMLEKERNTLKSAKESLEKEMKSLKSEKESLEEGKKTLQKSYDEAVMNLKSKDDKIKQLEENLKKKKETKSPRVEKGQTSTELKEAKEEIEELKHRLSQVVGAKIMDNNPNITDLSDENRPTKLSEKYSELYDNEWTDAFEEVEKECQSEQKVIQQLYHMLLDIFAFCQKTADEYSKNIKSCVLSLPSAANGKPNTASIGVTKKRQLKELQKSFSPYLAESVFKLYVKSKKLDFSKKGKTGIFTRTCIEICWLMSCQDPPVILDTANAKGVFDSDKFRTYTKSGKSVDYVVWPPLLLHKDGPLLCKGVAQGK